MSLPFRCSKPDEVKRIPEIGYLDEWVLKGRFGKKWYTDGGRFRGDAPITRRYNRLRFLGCSFKIQCLGRGPRGHKWYRVWFEDED